MSTRHSRSGVPFTACAIALTALAVVTSGASAGGDRRSVSVADGSRVPIVSIDNGRIRGTALPDGGFAFRGLRYAAAPIGELRWRAPQRPARWNGIRDAAEYAPSCPQPPSPFLPPGAISEDCLYLNVTTPAVRTKAGQGRPVLVWIHGGGLTQDAGRSYDGTKLARSGLVVVTLNYRLGALGFLAHPAFASRQGEPAGNYGLMDQQEALRWVKRNIAQFGGDPRNVTIAGQSAGGLSVLAHLVSRGSRGLFQRAIVQSGAFALTQQSLADAKAAGRGFADKAGCPDQTASCLRRLPVEDLVGNFPGAAIPGVVDGTVLTESIGTALAHGRFAHVPILNGVNHNEQLIFVGGLGLAVSGGTFVPIPQPVTAESYQRSIAAVLGVPAARASAIASAYPLDAYPAPIGALATLVSDASFACPALQVDRWASTRTPTFAYQFNDDSAPQRYAPPGALPPIATHSSELQYLLDLPNAPVPGPLSAAQKALATSMRAAWVSFARNGDPSSAAVRWPSFGSKSNVLSLASPRSRVERAFAAEHHCSLWATGS
jgi:para-nitrobenzyl esterase